MKTVFVTRDFAVRVSAQAFVQYLAETQYQRVPEAHARAIVAAKAGRIAGKADE